MLLIYLRCQFLRLIYSLIFPDGAIGEMDDYNIRNAGDSVSGSVWSCRTPAYSLPLTVPQSTPLSSFQPPAHVVEPSSCSTSSNLPAWSQRLLLLFGYQVQVCRPTDLAGLIRDSSKKCFSAYWTRFMVLCPSPSQSLEVFRKNCLCFCIFQGSMFICLLILCQR